MPKKILVYPYNEDFVPLIANNALPSDWYVESLVSPMGWGYCDCDAGLGGLYGSLGKNISGDFSAELKKCDTVLFCDFSKNIDVNRLIAPKIDLAVEQGKNIICCINLSDEYREALENRCKKNKLSFTYFSNNISGSVTESEIFESETIVLREIATPVVAILGAAEDLGKFDVQLIYVNYLKKLGYKVSLISSRQYAGIAGHRTIPSYMFGNKHTELEKIVLFNHYIKKIETTESPDIIVLGIPGGIIPISKKVLNRFGITAYEITRAVPPDLGILCLPFGNYLDVFFEHIGKVCKYRFSSEIAGYIISNRFFEMHAEGEVDNVSSMVLPIEALSQKETDIRLTNHQHTVGTLLDMNRVFEETIEKLHAFSQVEAL